MARIPNRRALMVLTVSLCFVAALLVATPLVNCPPVYDPWFDINGDGRIDLKDVYGVSMRFGATGTPIDKASIEYDSGWINITDKCGQYFSITHNLNSTDVIVDITGKTTIDGGVHQRHLGLTDYAAGWRREYGEVGDDYGRSLVQTSDGGYALAGFTNSYGAGGNDLWLIKTSSTGDIQWNRTYGGAADDYALDVIQTADGGYALAGATRSFGAGAEDIWLVKTDSLGNMQWNKTYGGAGRDVTHSVVQTNDGGYAIGGYTYSFGAGPSNFWLIKTDANGDTQWDKTYGGASLDEALSVVQTDDSGYAFAGYTWSFGAGAADWWLIKTDSSGNMQWNKTYGGTSTEAAWSVKQTSDGGYVLAGETTSFGAGIRDFWLIKTDSSGNMQWNKTYGGTSEDFGFSVVQTSDKGYAVAGYTMSFGAGGNDFWLIKTDADGNVQWSKTFGGGNNEGEFSGSVPRVVQSSDGGYALVGFTMSFGAGGRDFWLVKTGVESGLAWTDSTANTIILYRGATDPYWNFVRVRLWKPKS